MAYNRDELYKEALAAIEKHKLFFVEDVVSWLPCTKATFYEHFPVQSDEMNAIKEALDGNKIRIKINIRRKLLEGDKAAELLSLYRLVCTPEERLMLATSGDINIKLKPTDAPDIDLGRLTPAERRQWYALYEKASGKVIDVDAEIIEDSKAIENE